MITEKQVAEISETDRWALANICRSAANAYQEYARATAASCNDVSKTFTEQAQEAIKFAEVLEAC